MTKTTINETTGIAELAKGDALPECSESNVGEMLFAADSGAVLYCANGKWQTLNGKDGAAGENGESCEMETLDDGSGYKVLCGGDSVGVVLNGAKGEDGKTGENGESCEMETLDDGSGYKVLCGGDSIGVVLNGKKGQTGAKGTPGVNGKDGESCTLSDDGNGSVMVTCGTESATLYKAMCGTDPYDPAKSFCGNTGLKDTVVALCDGSRFDFLTKFCYDDGTSEKEVDRCNGAAYDFSTKFCYDDGTSEKEVDRCNGAAYDFSTKFCYDDGTTEVVVDRCNGAVYDFSTKFCYDNGTTEVVVDRCNGAAYNLSTHFCANTGIKDTVVALCNKATYNVSTHFCADGNTYKVSEYSFVTTKYLNQTMLKKGEYGYLIDSRDKQVYRTVTIGTQTWMAQNLNYDYVKNNNGNLETRTWCSDNNTSKTICETSGRLYLRGDSLTICPDGWKLPLINEWETLLKAVGWTNIDSIPGPWSDEEDKIVKAGLENVLLTASPEASWGSNMKTGTDNFGFSVVPAGYRYESGTMFNPTSRAYFMAKDWDYSSNNTDLVLVGWGVSLYRYQVSGAYSVRCIKK